MRRPWVIIVAATLATAVSASPTKASRPDADQRVWRDAVPRLPSPMPTIRYEDCPDLPGTGCVWTDGTVYAGSTPDRFTLRHELGHVAADQYLAEAERTQFMRRVGAQVWRSGSEDPMAGRASGNEQFADAYAHCRGRDLPRGRRSVAGITTGSWESSTDYGPSSNARHLAVCRLITRLLREPAPSA
jgi:hypothetical protein